MWYSACARLPDVAGTHVDQRLPERGVAPSAESPLRKRNNLHHGNTMATLPKNQSPRVLLLSDVAPPGERAQDFQSGVISSRSVRRFMFPCTHGAPLTWAACLEAPSIRGVESPARGHHRHETYFSLAERVRIRVGHVQSARQAARFGCRAEDQTSRTADLSRHRRVCSHFGCVGGAVPRPHCGFVCVQICELLHDVVPCEAVLSNAEC